MILLSLTTTVPWSITCFLLSIVRTVPSTIMISAGVAAKLVKEALITVSASKDFENDIIASYLNEKLAAFFIYRFRVFESEVNCNSYFISNISALVY